MIHIFYSLRFILVVAFLLGPSVIFARDVLDDLEGVYVVPGNSNAMPPRNDRGSKLKYATDCLVVKRIAPNRAEVYLSSIQKRGYQCNLEGMASLVDGHLELHDEDAIALVAGERAYLYVHSGVIRIGSSGTGPSYCGIHASIEGIAFPLNSKKTIPENFNAMGVPLSNACPRWNR